MNRFLFFCTFVVGLSAAFRTLAGGHFSGPVQTEWDPDGRHMNVIRQLEYVDSLGTTWIVPKGARTDGASIPQPFWSFVGGPFTGNYRDAAVVHDYYCLRRSRPWGQVHTVFYDAMLASGVPPSKAWIMYQAVVVFGPRWPEPKISPECQNPQSVDEIEKCAVNFPPPPISLPVLNKAELKRFIDELGPNASPEDVEQLKKILPTIQ